jgi:hypothetical protein
MPHETLDRHTKKRIGSLLPWANSQPGDTADTAAHNTVAHHLQTIRTTHKLAALACSHAGHLLSQWHAPAGTACQWLALPAQHVPAQSAAKITYQQHLVPA